MKEVEISFPDIDATCPSCNQDVFIDGSEAEPYRKALAQAVGYCEDCDEEFLVIIGGDL